MPESSTSGPARSEIEIEVRYAETDQMGVVHHANYLVWFELARTRLCARSGFHYAQIEELGYFLMVTAVDVEYRKGARYGDAVRVAAWIERLSSRGLTFGYEVFRGDQKLALGSTQHVWVEIATNKPRRMPEVLREPFERLAADRTGHSKAPSEPRTD
jgi:acyl-CoA thioester hydrolase